MDSTQKLFERDLRVVGAKRAALSSAIESIDGAPVEAQVAFIKELIKAPEKAAEFQKDPKKQLIDHGMILDPEVVKQVQSAVLFDSTVNPDFAKILGENGLKDIVDMRELVANPPSTAANVVAVAAVVAAAAAVATLVVTLIRADRQADLVRLVGRGPDGIRLPGGIDFQVRDPIVTPRMMRSGLPAFPNIPPLPSLP